MDVTALTTSILRL